MSDEKDIISEIYKAKKDIRKADELIRKYIPFIKSQTSKNIYRLCTEHDDEFSIAMIAFHEAIVGYEKEKGAFLNYAGLIIRSRIIDYQRKEQKHSSNLSLNIENQDNDRELLEEIIDTDDDFEKNENYEATKDEIEELAQTMKLFGIGFSDVSQNCPKQDRTLEACKKVISYAIDNREILDDLLKTKKLPISKLVKGSGVEKCTIERHRKYILAMLIIQTNGYEIIRGHLRRILTRKGSVQQ